MADLIVRRAAAVLRRAGLSPDDHLAVGLSGGVDSQVLTHVLVVLARARNWPLPYVVHVNHRLRAESDDDARRVVEVGETLGVAVEVVVVDVAAWDRHLRQGIEAAARAARYAGLTAAAARAGTSWLAVGHTLDDQVETALLGLLRGTGLEGVAGMRERTRRTVDLEPGRSGDLEIEVMRPLLTVPRREVEAYAARYGLVPVEDPSNRSLAFRRNLIRHLLVPVLDEIDPSSAAAIGRLTSRLQEDADYLRGAAERAMEDVVNLEDDGALIVIDRARFRSLHRALRRRVVLRAVELVAAAGRRMSLDRVIAAADAVADGAVATRVEVGGNIDCYIDYEIAALGAAATLEDHLRRRSGEPLLEPGREGAIDPVGEGPFALGNGWRLTVSRSGSVDAVVRTRRPGDRIELAGGGLVRLQDWFTNRKVPVYLRDWLPLLVIDGRVRWVALSSRPGFQSEDGRLHLAIESVRIERDGG